MNESIIKYFMENYSDDDNRHGHNEDGDQVALVYQVQCNYDDMTILLIIYNYDNN